jgi:hypothetical protein
MPLSATALRGALARASAFPFVILQLGLPGRKSPLVRGASLSLGFASGEQHAGEELAVIFIGACAGSAIAQSIPGQEVEDRLVHGSGTARLRSTTQSSTWQTSTIIPGGQFTLKAFERLLRR